MGGVAAGEGCEAYAVLPSLFGGVQGGIGGFDQFVARRSVLREQELFTAKGAKDSQRTRRNVNRS